MTPFLENTKHKLPEERHVMLKIEDIQASIPKKDCDRFYELLNLSVIKNFKNCLTPGCSNGYDGSNTEQIEEWHC
jgi:hypothetical protein